MGTHSTRKLSVLFAAWTLVVIAAVTATMVVLRLREERVQLENQTAAAASRVIAPILAVEVGDLSEPALASLTERARDLLSDRVSAIRVWDGEGRLLASTDQEEVARIDALPFAEALDGEVSAFQAASSSGDLLVSYAPLTPGTALEVHQGYGPVQELIVDGRGDTIFVATAGAVVLFLVLQVTLWAVSHGVTSQYDRLLYLYRIGQEMRSSLDLTHVLEQLARDTALFTRSQLGLVALMEEGGAELVLRASYDSDDDSAGQHQRTVDEWFMRRSAVTGETVVAQVAGSPYRTLLGREPTHAMAMSILCVPIPGREQPMGVVALVRRRAQGAFAAPEVQMVEEMAAQSAMAVEQAALFAKVRAYAGEVEMSYDTTLKVLMAALDTKDSATEGHSERVAQLTVAVAREMGIPQERLVDMERGALLHDVGKIGVPDEVLTKPRELNEGEWEAMRKHPLLAGLMVSKVEFLEGALPILLYHHERYDGTGYPFGLAGDAIPLEARIFAVVDSYDAMTSDRPYRDAMSREAALREIRAGADTQFDPKVVEAFLRVMSRQRALREKAA